MRKLSIYIALILFISLLAGCTTTSKDKKDNHVIYTSVYPLEYVTKAIAGDTVTVKSIYPAGVDVHSYEPTAKEMTSIARGDALIYIGAGLESFTDTLVQTLSEQKLSFLEIGKNEELFLKNKDDHEHDDADDHDHGPIDPHIWLDPIRMIDIGKMVQNEMIDLYPKNKDLYEKNFAQLKTDLAKLDEDFHKQLDPKTNKHILVSHEAYGYWENRYGIEQIAINGMFEDEPSQKKLAQIARTAEKKNIKYVIFEQSGSSRVTKIIQDNIGAKALFIHNLEVRTDKDIKAKDDYIDLMRQNLKTLDQATN